VTIGPVDVLSILLLLGSGIAAGVLFAVALSTVPALATMTPDRYVQTHKLLGRNWDPIMPLIVLGSTLLDIGLVVLGPTPLTRVLFAGGAVSLLGVALVSHLGNVPINRRLRMLEPGAIPPDWQDPRPVWRRWHLVRTGLALVALAANSIAVTLM
jgi:uncharacterized membrane protein